MSLSYTVVKSRKEKRGWKIRWLGRAPNMKPAPVLKFLRDDTGAIIRIPKPFPWQDPKRLDRPEDPQCLEGEPAYWGGVSREELERMQWTLNPKGPLMLPGFNLRMADNDRRAACNFWRVVLEAGSPAPSHSPRKLLFLPRKGAVNRRPWAAASGNHALREKQAAHYLRIFNHENAMLFDAPVFTMLKVVCNLRNRFGMDQQQAAMLMKCLFNPKLKNPWTQEGIALAWNLVADYTPGLGLRDAKAIAKQRKFDIEEEVTELLAHTRPGSRVEIHALLAVLNEWFPDLHASATELGRAVRAITGIRSGTSKGKCYYSGFHLPKASELPDSHHVAVLELSTPIVPRHPTTSDPNPAGVELGQDFSACFVEDLQDKVIPLLPADEFTCRTAAS